MTIKKDYTFIKSQLKKALQVNDRLSRTIEKMESKFDDTKESVEYITKKADYHIKSRNHLIAILQKRLEKKN